MPDFAALEKLACPECDGLSLQYVAEQLHCMECNKVFPFDQGFPCLLRGDNRVQTKLDEYHYDDDLNMGESLPEVLLQNWGGVFSSVAVDHPEVLELGCGSGYLTVALAEHFSFSAVHAVDISPVFLQMAQERLNQIEHGAAHQLYICDANFLPFAPRTFDVVVGRSVLHHFLDYEKILARIARLLKPGGMAVFYEPVIQGKAKIALMVQLALMINHRLAEPVLDETDTQKLRRLHQHLVKQLHTGDDRNKLEQMEDKYIFDVQRMRETGLRCGFSKVDYRNRQSRDGDFRVGLERHLLEAGLSQDKARKFTFLSRAWRENMVSLLPDEQYTPMGFFMFHKSSGSL